MDRSTEMKAGRKGGFTLVEMLVVVAIIALLAAILVPSLGVAQKTARNRKADLECNSIKTAVDQFFAEFHYMPWKVSNDKDRVGDDKWATSAADQQGVIEMLQGENKLGKSYLDISSRGSGKGSSDESGKGVFLDPWGNVYRIGLDRNLDQQIDFNGKAYKARVLVYSLGPDGKDNTKDDIRTFDLAD